jgi:hypothetical protein
MQRRKVLMEKKHRKKIKALIRNLKWKNHTFDFKRVTFICILFILNFTNREFMKNESETLHKNIKLQHSINPCFSIYH